MKNKECKSLRPKLVLFADGELSAQESAWVRSHLMDCIDCRSIVGEVYSTRRFFEAETPVSVPEGFAANVASLAFSQGPVERTGHPSLPFVQILVAIAASLVLVMGSFLLWNEQWKANSGVDVQAGTLSSLDQDIDKFVKEQGKQKHSPKNKKAPEKK